MTEVRITCKTKDSLPLSKLTAFQGDLKSLSDTNYEKLKRQIEEHGFTAPFFVWQNEGSNYLLDGHQRKVTLDRMAREGYDIPGKLPVVFIEAPTQKDAKKILLGMVSQYGIVESQGLLDFMKDIDFTIPDLSDFEIPNIDLSQFSSFVAEKSRDENTENEEHGIDEESFADLESIEGLKSPFPYFGGKSRVAGIVWNALGQPKHYIEPFFGSGAVLLLRPDYDPTAHVETVNDKDGFIANVWRALQSAPDEVAKWCDWPVNHADLSARKKTLIANEGRLLENLIADEKWCDPVMAGYWIWAACCWIGSGLTSIGQRPHICGTGVGVTSIGQIPRICGTGVGVQEPYNTNIYSWFRELSERLRNVRVVCGDWNRVCGGNWQDNMGVCGMFFDPPYSVSDRDQKVYHHDSITVAQDVNKWVAERGANPKYRIVLAGYFEEHENLLAMGWTHKRWKTGGGYSNVSTSAEQTQGQKNRFKEALFFSPHCEVKSE
jgi:DNA adenine methylase